MVEPPPRRGRNETSSAMSFPSTVMCQEHGTASETTTVCTDFVLRGTLISRYIATLQLVLRDLARPQDRAA